MMYRVEMAFGHKDCNGLALPAERIMQAEYLALGAFVQQFPGAQIDHRPGAYRKHDNQVIVEPSTSVWAYAINAAPALAPLSSIARTVAAMLHQESVLLVIIEHPGQMYWVDSGKP